MDTWSSTWLEAYMWHCGDDHCNCFQPRIDRVRPGVHRPWIKRELVWEGTFHSDPDCHEYEQQVDELKRAAEDHGITLDDNHHGKREDQHDTSA